MRIGVQLQEKTRIDTNDSKDKFCAVPEVQYPVNIMRN